MNNLTFKNNKVFKIYDSNVNEATGTLTIRFLPSDYSLNDIKSFFDDKEIKDQLSEIIKTTDTGTYICTYVNYTGIKTKASSVLVNVTVESTREVTSLNESGESITVKVPTTETRQIELIVVILGYENPIDVLVGKLNQQINPSIDIDTCTLNELKAWEKTVINNACTSEIENGVDVQLSDGKTYHFSYKLVDQINYSEMYQEIEYDGYANLPYHPDGGGCTIYSAADIKTIILAQRTNKFVLTTKCNAYHRMIDEATTNDDILKITWGSALSKEERQALNNILSTITPKK